MLNWHREIVMSKRPKKATLALVLALLVLAAAVVLLLSMAGRGGLSANELATAQALCRLSC